MLKFVIFIPKFDLKNGQICNKKMTFLTEKCQGCHFERTNMWLDNLKEFKKQKGLTSKQIAEIAKLPERTVVRIFSGDTPNPYADTLYRIAEVLDVSLDDILADSKAVVGSANLATLQAEVERLNSELSLMQAEKAVLEDKARTLSAENDLLRMKLEHKYEIIAIHNYYNKINCER